MADSPLPQIALSGANTLAAANMTKTDSTNYSLTHTVGAGNGAANVALSVGTDLAGNPIATNPTSGPSFTVDNSPPVSASVSVPANGSSYNTSTLATFFSGIAADNNTGSGLAADSTTFYLQRTADSKYWTGTTWDTPILWLATQHGATTSNASASWTDNIALPTIEDGAYKVKAKATDKAGNAFEGAEITFTVDTAAAVAAPVITGPNGGNNFITNQAAQTITGSKASEASEVRVSINGGAYPPATIIDGTSWSYHTELATDGEYSFIAQARTDNSQPWSIPSNQITITYDSVSPQLTVDQADQIVTNPQITLTGTASDTRTNVTVTVNGSAANLDGTNWSKPITLLPANNVLTITAQDQAANTTTIIRNIYLNQAPAQASQPVPANDALNLPLNTSLSWTVSDPDAYDSGQLKYNVYFGTAAANLPLVSENQPGTTFRSTTALETNTDYYWRIDVKDSQNILTTGLVWHFKTAGVFTLGGAVRTAGANPVAAANMEVALSDGRSTRTNSTGNYQFDNLSAGEYTVTINGQNGLTFTPDGGSSTITVNANTTLNFTAQDIQNPTVSITAPQEGDAIQSTALTVTGRAGDNLIPFRVVASVKLNGLEVDVKETTTFTPQANEYNWAITGFDKGSNPAGWYVIEVYAYDTNNTSTMTSVGFTLS